MLQHLRPFAPLILLILISCSILYYGYVLRAKLLNANLCNMTYTSREKSLIKIDGIHSKYKLWKISNPGSQNNILNYQPVLFIPGHLGSVDQVRSLNSKMHNGENYFQYFSLDFNEETSAFHGSEILSMASFTNEALKTIRTQYTKSNKTFDSIMIVGHSIGGMIARTSLLLNNHPKCDVSDIIMLSTPNMKAPFTMDASLERVYNAVNKAWILSYYNTSSSCISSSLLYKQQLKDQERNSNNNNNNTKTTSVSVSNDINNVALSMDTACPVCVPKVRLVSISGGEIDMHVTPSLTQLHEMTARPRNLTLDKALLKSNRGFTGLLVRVNQVVSQIFHYMTFGMLRSMSGYFYAKPNKSLNSDNTTTIVVSNATLLSTNSSSGNETCDSNNGDVNGQCESILANSTVNTTTTTPTTNSSSNNSNNKPVINPNYEFITKDIWNHQIMKYIEPQYITLRTSQLKQVGFPIDHTAILWCHQLLQVITKGMKTLSKSSSLSSRTTLEKRSVDMHKIFDIYNVSSIESAVNSVKSLEIPQLESFIAHNESNYLWNVAEINELQEFHEFFKYNTLSMFSFMFVTRHLVKILSCYLLISCLTLTVYVFRGLTNNKTSPLDEATNWKQLLLQTHSNYDIISATILNILQYILPIEIIPGVITFGIRMIIIVLSLKFIYDYQFTNYFYVKYTPVFNWIVSYGLALTLRSILLALLLTMRSIVYFISRTIRVILRLTIWNKTIRHTMRKTIKLSDSKLSSTVPYYDTIKMIMTNSIRPLIPISIWVSIHIKTRYRISGSNPILDNVTYGFSIITITFYMIMTAGIVFAIIKSPYDHSKDTESYYYFNELTLLFLPAPILALPSLQYAWKLLYAPLSIFHTSIPLYHIFGPERINFSLAIVMIGIMIWRVRISSNYIKNMASLTWMEELFGPHTLITASKVYPSDYKSSMFRALDTLNTMKSLSGNLNNSSNSTCCHEDGGRDAIFEQITINDKDHKYVSKNVILGSTYRVIYCNCAQSIGYKDIQMWCEYCLCRKCGGKNLPKDYNNDNNNASSSRVRNLDAKDFSMDLLLLISLYGVGIVLNLYYHLEANPYLYFYYLGLIACAQLIQIFYAKH